MNEGFWSGLRARENPRLVWWHIRVTLKCGYVDSNPIYYVYFFLRKLITVVMAELVDFDKVVSLMSSTDVLEMHSKFVGFVQDVCKLTKGIFGSMEGDRVVLYWNAANAVGNHAEQVVFLYLT